MAISTVGVPFTRTSRRAQCSEQFLPLKILSDLISENLFMTSKIFTPDEGAKPFRKEGGLTRFQWQLHVFQSPPSLSLSITWEEQGVDAVTNPTFGE